MKQWYFVIGFYNEEDMNTLKNDFNVKNMNYVSSDDVLDSAAFHGFFNIDLDDFKAANFIDILYNGCFIEESTPSHVLVISVGEIKGYSLEFLEAKAIGEGIE